jgi:hypothetical protein
MGTEGLALRLETLGTHDPTSEDEMRIREALGRIVGKLWAPFVTVGSLTRNARLFHPDGVLYWAHVQPIANDGMLGELAQRLEGPALVRLSSAWWRHEKEWPDILGIAIRFVDNEKANASGSTSRDQDLLFATIRRTITLPLAPLSTDTHDFMANDYFALLPFEVEGIGRAKFRLLPMRLPKESGNRREKLEARIVAGTAVFRIEMKKALPGARWKEIASVEIREEAHIDQRTLVFDPFRTGRGIVPTGLIQMVRRATYPASVLGRTLMPK